MGDRAPLVARAATLDDVDELLRLRQVMFDSMGVVARDPAWVESCRDHLVELLGTEALYGAVVDHPDGGGAIASGLVEFHVRIPGSQNVLGRTAYISSIATDEGFRRRGAARSIMVHLLDEIRRRGVEVIDLHATSVGEGLYRDLGFAPRAQPELRLNLELGVHPELDGASS
ncbi:MAG: GNAT family N-acetyltransferase [Acidimicrobiales bacterium]|nr:GNAT family N-acetyltransferase [Acidimicrobiales bacterium]